MTPVMFSKIEYSTPPIIQQNAYGGRFVEFDDDAHRYYIQENQKWLPHCVYDPHHPATIGEHVALSRWLGNSVGLKVGIISGKRTHLDTRYGTPTRQVELLGLPLRWFAIDHFDEYEGKQIPSRQWPGWTMRFEY